MHSFIILIADLVSYVHIASYSYSQFAIALKARVLAGINRGILSFESKTTEIFQMGEYYYRSGVTNVYGMDGILFDISE